MQSLAGTPSGPLQAVENSGRLRLHVLFTTLEETRVALQRAAQLASGLDAKVVLILTPIVPFPLPLDQPPTSIDFAQRQIGLLADVVDGDFEGFVYLCRDPSRLLATILPPRAVILMGIHRSWPLGKSRRLARALRRRGYQVITPTPAA